MDFRLRQARRTAPIEVKKHLGYLWDPATDSVTQRFDPKPLLTASSRSQVVSVLSTLFDPLGLYLESQLILRLAMREAVRDTAGWSAEVPTNLLDKVLALAARVEIAKVPRYENVQMLSVFVDASNVALAWLCWGGGNNRLMARAALTPIGCKWSTPRRELTALWRAALDLVELAKTLKCLGKVVESITFLTDSSITVYRLRRPDNDRKLPSFERRRLQQIRAAVSALKAKVQHIAGDANPADGLSRPGESVEMPCVRKVKSAIVASAVGYDPEESHGVFSGEEETCFHPDLLQESALSVSMSDEKEPLGLLGLKESAVQAQKRHVLPKVDARFVAENGILYRRVACEIRGNGDTRETLQLVVPDEAKDLQKLIVRNMHEQWGHRGVQKTTQMLSLHFYWRRFKSDIRNHVRRCDICNRKRGLDGWNKQVGVVRWPGSCAALEVLGVDITGPYKTESDEYVYGLVATCLVTKYILAAPISRPTTQQIVDQLHVWFSEFGKPSMIITDRGKRSAVGRSHAGVECLKSMYFTFPRMLPIWLGGKGRTKICTRS